VYSGSERVADVEMWITKGDVDGLRTAARKILGEP
jgi:hypothetical protein